MWSAVLERRKVRRCWLVGGLAVLERRKVRGLLGFFLKEKKKREGEGRLCCVCEEAPPKM